MFHLYEKTSVRWDDQPFVARITSDPQRANLTRHEEVFLIDKEAHLMPTGFRAYLCRPDAAGKAEEHISGAPILLISREFAQLVDGDVIYVSPRTGEIQALHRQTANANTVFLTESCNCRCIMCPQPPRTNDDGHWIRVWLSAIPLINPQTQELGISGGEPTMCPDALVALLRACRNWLPETSVQVLTNGRMFNYMTFCREIAKLKHPDLLFGISLHSDLAEIHDHISGVERAFDQTIRGIMNLRRHGLRTEIRVVVMTHNAERLPDIAYFIVRNLPFVEHVAVMGLEPVGWAKVNLKNVWIDPADYCDGLRDAVHLLSVHDMNVSIFNHQLCTIDPSLWRFARKSISDWKNDFVDECSGCAVRNRCAGLFSSSVNLHSRAIRRIDATPVGVTLCGKNVQQRSCRK